MGTTRTRSLGELAKEVTGGMVRRLVGDLFSSNEHQAAVAEKNVADFLKIADNFTDLTASRKQVTIVTDDAELIKTEQAKTDAEDTATQQRQMREIATAKRGLQVSMAWVDRLTELRRWRGAKVFLGGSCNPTTWREDIAIPAFTQAGVPFYNPQVDDWSPDLVEIEAQEKETAGCLLFVIDRETRAMASIVEAAEYICLGRRVVLCIVDVEEESSIGGEAIGKPELKDLNRMRAYLRDVATRNGVSYTNQVSEAVAEVISSHREGVQFAAEQAHLNQQRQQQGIGSMTYSSSDSSNNRRSSSSRSSSSRRSSLKKEEVTLSKSHVPKVRRYGDGTASAHY